MPAAPAQMEATRPLIADVQRELARRGLYDGVEDGVMGSRTAAAITAFQRGAGLPQTGEVSPELLGFLKAPTPDPAVRPQQVAAPLPKPNRTPAPASRTAANTPAPASSAARNAASARPMENIGLHGDDPVAAAIRSSNRSPMMTPPADIGSARPVRPVAPGPAGATQLVLQIQKGLANIAYTDVETDGLAGAQTRAAIRRFEKHYRLPETGEPNEAVLKKLTAIGAL
jgi:peptidoglycan hydrolase-like protein with peptidoglycan-binding domain